MAALIEGDGFELAFADFFLTSGASGETGVGRRAGGLAGEGRFKMSSSRGGGRGGLWAPVEGPREVDERGSDEVEGRGRGRSVILR